MRLDKFVCSTMSELMLIQTSNGIDSSAGKVYRICFSKGHSTKFMKYIKIWVVWSGFPVNHGNLFKTNSNDSAWNSDCEALDTFLFSKGRSCYVTSGRVAKWKFPRNFCLILNFWLLSKHFQFTLRRWLVFWLKAQKDS